MKNYFALNAEQFTEKVPGQFLIQIEEEKQVLRQCNWH